MEFVTWSFDSLRHWPYVAVTICDTPCDKSLRFAHLRFRVDFHLDPPIPLR